MQSVGLDLSQATPSLLDFRRVSLNLLDLDMKRNATVHGKPKGARTSGSVARGTAWKKHRQVKIKSCVDRQMNGKAQRG